VIDASVVAATAQGFVGPQSLTFAIPVGMLAVIFLWGFFQRRRPTR
jgi:hypothetical protein